MLGAKRPALVTTLARQVLHSLEPEHVPNCDTMQQRVAVVKPTGLNSRRQALGLVQVQMFSDSAQVADVIVGKCANIVDMSPKIKSLIKHNTKISNSFGWVSYNGITDSQCSSCNLELYTLISTSGFQALISILINSYPC